MDPVLLLKMVAAPPIVFFVPGYVISNAFRIGEMRTLKLGFLETVFLQILISIVVTGLFAFILALLGVFSLTLLLVLLSAFSFILAIKFKVNLHLSKFPTPRLNLQSLFLVLLIVLATILFAHPFQFDIFHFREGGNNITMGIILAKHGTFFFRDSFFSSIPEEYRSIFFQTEGGRTFLFPSYPFFVDAEGIVEPSYPFFYPVWIAIFVSMFGVSGSLFINPFFAILSVVGIYVILRRMIDSRTAILASLFLTISFLTIYFAWYHGNEMMFQLLTIFFLLSFQYHLLSKRNFFAVFSGLLMTELLLVRIDALVFAIGIFFFILTCNSSTGKLVKRFILYFLISVPLVIFTYVTLMSAYFGRVLLPYETYLQDYDKALIFYLAVISVILLVLGIRFRHVIGRIIRRHHKGFFLVILLGFFSYAIFSYPTDREFNNMYNLIALSWYMGVLGVLLSLLGFVLFILRSKKEDQKLLLSLYVPFFIIFIQDLHNYPLHPWAMRRYISFLYPFLVAFMAYAVLALATTVRLNKSRLNRAIPIGIAGVLVFSFITIDAPLLRLIGEGPENPSIIEQVGDMNAYFPEKSIIIFHIDSYEFTPALPLKSIWDRNTILMERIIIYGEVGEVPRIRILDKEVVTESYYGISKYLEMTKIWEEQGHPVFIINPSQEFLSRISSYDNVDLVHEKTFTIGFHHIPLSYNGFPSNAPSKYEQILMVFRLSVT